MIKAVAYMRTSSGTNVGEGKDSVPRQRAAIMAYASSAGIAIDEADYFYDPAVRGEDRIESRPGFAAMLDRIEGNGVRTVIVEDASRFARDLIVQLTGHDYLKKRGIVLIAANAPSHFIEETHTAVLIRQILGAIAQFEKACVVAKLKAARDRKKKAGGKCEGRKSLAEMRPIMVERARELNDGQKSLRAISATLAWEGHLTPSGKPYSPSAVRSMLASGD